MRQVDGSCVGNRGVRDVNTNYYGEGLLVLRRGRG